MPDAPPRTPAEWLSAILLWLCLTVDGHSTWGRLTRPFGRLILRRIQGINRRFARLADRIGAGTYVQRRYPARRTPIPTKPRRPDALPHSFGWLLRLVPETAAYSSQLQRFLSDAEVAALMATAPAPLRRPLRSLCRMLGVAPPPELAVPRVLARPVPARPVPVLPAPVAENPSPAGREREGPVAARREGEGAAARPRPAQAPPPRTDPPPPAGKETRFSPLPRPA